MRTPCVTQSEHTDSERERVLYNNNNPMGRTFFLFSFHVESEASLYDGILKSVARSREKTTNSSSPCTLLYHTLLYRV